MEGRHLKPINISKRKSQRPEKLSPSLSCDWPGFSFSVIPPTEILEAPQAVIKENKKERVAA